MNTLQSIRERRSIKHFDPDHNISESEINTLTDHLILSPTSFNIQNWRFVLIKEKTKKKLLKEAAYGQKQLEDASLSIILCADLMAHKQGKQYWSKADPEVQKIVVPMINKFYDGNAQIQRDEAIRSVGIAAQTLMLSAKSIGYDSCPMIGFDSDKVANIIQLPHQHMIVMIVCIGKAMQPAQPRSGPMPKSKLIFRESFKQ